MASTIARRLLEHTQTGALMAAARQAWPEIAVADDVLLDHLAGKLAPDQPIAEQLARLRVGDLLLAIACAGGDRAALAAFERAILGDLPGMLAHLKPSADLVDETAQALRARLFTGPRPRILDYAGTGDLHSWVRVAAARTAISLLRQGGRDLPVGDHALLDAAGAGADPELAHLEATYGAELRAAFAETVAGLSSKERNLLRYQILDRLTVDQVGVLYGVHRATAARWMERARERVVAGTRRLLRRKLGVGAGELDSIMRLVDSRLDLSISRLLHCSKQ